MAYGYGTKSHLRSTEYQQLKQERAEFTKKFEAGQITLPASDARLFMTCTCRSFRYVHTLDAHEKLKSDHDWRPWEVRERAGDYERFKEPVR